MAAAPPVAPVPPVAPAQPVLAQPVQGPRSYREFYDNADNDPYRGQYAAVVADFTVPLAGGAAGVTPQQLATRVYASAQCQGSVNAFLLLARPAYDPQGTGEPKVILVHRVSQYTAQIGLPTAYDNAAFAFKGDVVGAQADIAAVFWQQTYFNQTNQLRVCTQEVHDQMLADDENLALVGPFDANDAGTEVQRTRHTAYVPPKYIGLFLEQDLSPSEACERCCAAIEVDGLSAMLEDLRFWLRAAMTRQAPNVASPLVLDHPAAPVPTPELAEHFRQLLFRDLPALSNTVIGQGAQLIAGAVGNLVDEQRQSREASLARRAADVKTPDTFLGTAVQPLIRLAQVATSAQLPPVWQALADAPKAQQRNVIQLALEDAIQLCAPGGLVTNIVTPSLAKKIALEFRMNNPDDLSTGVQPFILVQTTPLERQSAQQLVDVYNTVMAGSTSSVPDAQYLVADDKALLPVSWYQTRTSLIYLRAIILLTLGINHPWTMALGAFLGNLMAHEGVLQQLQPRDPQYRNLVPALVVRWVQLRWSTWLNQQWISPVNVPVPDIAALFTRISLNDGWEPQIPAPYLRLHNTPALVLPPAIIAGAADTDSSLPGGGTPRLPPANPNPNATVLPNAPVRNANYLETEFGQFRQIPVRIRDLLARQSATPPPVSSFDSPTTRTNPNVPLRICVAYHVKGMCNQRCGRAGDHHPLTAAKRQELVTWCRAHYTAA